jgi:hypothetical protein
MPVLKTYIVKRIPAEFLGFRSRPPLTDELRANGRAEDFPDLVAEGLSGPIYIEAISAYSGRNGVDGRPMLWRLICAKVDAE